MSILELGTLQAELGALPESVYTGNFTTIVVTAQYSSEGQPGVGTVTFTLTRTLINGDLVVPCSPLIVPLDATGKLNVTLVAIDDPGTIPTGVWYAVTEQVQGCQPRDPFIQVSATGPNPVQLAALLPGNTGWT